MKGRKICFFLGAFWLLVICTILSNSIERQMTVKVQVLEPKLSMSEIATPMPVYSSEILSSGNLFEAIEGSEWESGFRAKIVSPEFYITEENHIQLIPSNGISGIILYRTKELSPDAVVQKTMPYQGKESLYLTISTEKEPFLSSMAGKEPYMENRQKEELGLLPEERLYSISEMENFSKMFPPLGLLLALLISTLLIWIYTWKLSENIKKNRTPLLINGGVLALLLLGIYKLSETIQMPSSLLPKENILDFEHYRETFGQILGALEQLQQVGNAEAGKLLEGFQQDLLLGCMATIVPVFIFCIFVMAVNNLWKNKDI